MLQTLYRGLTQIGGPAIRYYLDRRLQSGKEDGARHGERLGVPSLPRPPGPLVWFHAASVGESLSVLVLLERMLERNPALHVLVTTGTVTSAQLMARRLPPRAMHQYVPVDRPAYVTGFLDHWRPDLVLWIESEIWPNLLWDVGQRGIPAALLNARMSARSCARWQAVPGFIGPLLGVFGLCLAQTAADARRLESLGARGVVQVGNLKYSAQPPPADPRRLADLVEAVGARPCWLFASTHPGEEDLAGSVHLRLAPAHPGLLTVIAPRHPQRGEAIAAALASRGLRVSRRSQGALPALGDDVYLADTMGEMGILYRTVPLACMGGSFVPHGGQNPIEPAQAGCALLYGPHMHNFAEVGREMEQAGAALPLPGGEALPETLTALLSDPARRQSMAAAALAVTERHRRVVDAALEVLRPLFQVAGVA